MESTLIFHDLRKTQALQPKRVMVMRVCLCVCVDGGFVCYGVCVWGGVMPLPASSDIFQSNESGQAQRADKDCDVFHCGLFRRC